MNSACQYVSCRNFPSLFIKTRKWVFLFLIIWIPLGCGSEKHLMEISGPWKFHRGFDQAWLSGHNTGSMENTVLPRMFYSTGNNKDAPGIFTLQAVLPLELAIKAEREGTLAFESGEMTSHRIDCYINEKMIGSVGTLDPFNPAMGRNIVRVIPGDAFHHSGGNYLTMVFSREGSDRVGHGIYGYPLIGNTGAVYFHWYRENIIGLVLVTIYLMIGIIFFLLGLRRPADLYNLYFGLFALFFSLFEMANLQCSEIIFGDNVLLRMRVDQVSLKLMIAAFVLFISHLFHREHRPFVLVLTAYCFFLAFLDIFKTFEYNLDDRYNFWHLAVITGFPYTLHLMIKKVRGGNTDAAILLAGILVFVAGSVHDILLDSGLIEGTSNIRYASLGFFVCMVLMLVNRFVRLLEESRELNQNLEMKVTERSEELRAANEQIRLLSKKEKFMNTFQLTAREREILSLMMDGHSGNELAVRLDISYRTLNNHVYNMYRKMGVHSHLEIFALFNRL